MENKNSVQRPRIHIQITEEEVDSVSRKDLDDKAKLIAFRDRLYSFLFWVIGGFFVLLALVVITDLNLALTPGKEGQFAYFHLVEVLLIGGIPLAITLALLRGLSGKDRDDDVPLPSLFHSLGKELLSLFKSYLEKK